MKNAQLLEIQNNVKVFEANKNIILSQWIEYAEPKTILAFHDVDLEYFRDYYASGVFDYFMEVIGKTKDLGDCPIMHELLVFLKDREISANELFTICSHFRRAVVDFSYDIGINSKALFDEISFVFDENFSGVLKLYTDTIYQKELLIAKNVQFLNEYKKALDESAIVFKTDVYGTITHVNSNFCKISGYSKEELLGNSHFLVKHPDTPIEFYQQMSSSLENEQVFKGQIKNLTKEGQTYYLDLTVLSILDPIKEKTEYIAIGYEVTTLIETRQEAVAASLAKELFLSSMSHEIRTPLNAILGFVTILLEEENNAKHAAYLKIINDSGENLLGIINDILDFSKLRSGAFTIEKKIFNSHDEFSHVLELFSQAAYRKNILINSFIDPKMPYELISDPLRIKQVFSNLLSNAIKFTPEGGEIDIRVTYEDKQVNICVCDNGKGVNDESILFDAFKQEKDAQGGTGLGLSISKDLAEHMDGTITYSKVEPKGSMFEFNFKVEEPSNIKSFPFDPTPFQKLRIALFCATNKKEVLYLRQYFDAFELNTFCITQLDEREYDLLFFMDTTDSELRSIRNLDVPSIALQRVPSKEYQDDENITSLNYPIYCEKMYHAFIEALKMTPRDDEKYVKKFQQRRFKGHVLVAEDNIANQEFIKIILERYGLSYYIASDGLEAVETFKLASFNLVFMDKQMPIKDGVEATKDILMYEEAEHKEHTPIVGLSADVSEGDGLSFGHDGFLGKPLVIKEFEAILQKYLVEHSSVVKEVVPPSFSANNIDLHLLKEELMLDESEVKLLLQTFRDKMKKSFPILSFAVDKNSYKKISLEAHSIKGSAANFRFENLEILAKSMELSARKEDADFDYKKALDEMEQIMAELM